jgi:hypothetical protein
MNIKPSDVISLGALALAAYLEYVKTKNKAVIYLLVIVGLTALGASIFSRSKPKDEHVNQTATASGRSTNYQAGRDIVINQGVSEAIVRGLLNQKLISEHTALGSRYPAGYVIFGISNGAIVYLKRLRDVQIATDWNENFQITIDQSKNEVQIIILKLVYSKRGQPDLQFDRIVEYIRLVENNPISSHVIPDTYYEVLDASNKIFVMGFK